MNLAEFQLTSIGLNKNDFGRIFTFVDFGNVTYWYHNDERDWENKPLGEERRLIIDIQRLAAFLKLFSDQKRFYYGWDPRSTKSQHLIVKAEKCGFVKITKPVQFIKHYLDEEEIGDGDREFVKTDRDGRPYVEIRKGNFDVEISVDSIRLMKKYDTFCLLSGDSDFAHLARFLKKNGKKVIVMASGQVYHSLKDVADLYVNAQKVKSHIAAIKELRPLRGEVSISDPSRTDKAA